MLLNSLKSCSRCARIIIICIEGLLTRLWVLTLVNSLSLHENRLFQERDKIGTPFFAGVWDTSLFYWHRHLASDGLMDCELGRLRSYWQTEFCH